jgi:CheY-like chemotaxis protein
VILTHPEIDPSFRVNPSGVQEPFPTIRVLIVEDSAVDRETLKKLLTVKVRSRLTLARVEIILADSMSEGLIHASVANCTILDLCLRDSDQNQTIARIKDFRPPVIVVTGIDDPDTERQCIAAGAEHVFVKGQIHGLVTRVVDCIVKDLLRLNDDMAPHGDAAK